jgi:B-cell receptor-associated protein 31
MFLMLFVEHVVALLMMVKVGSLRELSMRVLDQVKKGKGPATVKTLVCMLSMILMSNVANILKIQNRGPQARHRQPHEPGVLEDAPP